MSTIPEQQVQSPSRQQPALQVVRSLKVTRLEPTIGAEIALPYYQRQLFPKLQALGVPLVAVSPQVPERLIEIKQRHELQFQVATDKDNTLARQLGILYSFDEASRKAALSKGGGGIGDVTGTGTWELPQPAVVVIGQHGEVIFAEVSPDWLVRTEAEVIVQAVSEALGEREVQIAV